MVRVVAEVPASGAADGVLGADSDAESEEPGGDGEDEEDDESDEDDEESAAAEAEQPRASGQVPSHPHLTKSGPQRSACTAPRRACSVRG